MGRGGGERQQNPSLSWVSASRAQDYIHPNSLYFRGAGRASKLGFMGLMAFFCLPLPVSLTANLTLSPPRAVVWALPGAQTSQEGSAIAELLPLVSGGGGGGRPETPPGAQPLPHASPQHPFLGEGEDLSE